MAQPVRTVTSYITVASDPVGAGFAQIVTTTINPDGSKNISYSPAFGKAQIAGQIASLTPQLAALNDALADAGLVQP